MASPNYVEQKLKCPSCGGIAARSDWGTGGARTCPDCYEVFTVIGGGAWPQVVPEKEQKVPPNRHEFFRHLDNYTNAVLEDCAHRVYCRTGPGKDCFTCDQVGRDLPLTKGALVTFCVGEAEKEEEDPDDEDYEDAPPGYITARPSGRRHLKR